MVEKERKPDTGGAVICESVHFFGKDDFLKNRHILILFLALFAFVGIDVGLNVYVPDFLQTRCGLPLQQAGLGSSLYFTARIIGSLIGAVLLLR